MYDWSAWRELAGLKESLKKEVDMKPDSVIVCLVKQEQTNQSNRQVSRCALARSVACFTPATRQGVASALLASGGKMLSPTARYNLNATAVIAYMNSDKATSDRCVALIHQAIAAEDAADQAKENHEHAS